MRFVVIQLNVSTFNFFYLVKCVLFYFFSTRSCQFLMFSGLAYSDGKCQEGKKCKEKYLPLSDINNQKYSRLSCLLLVKGLVSCIYFGWSGMPWQNQYNKGKFWPNFLVWSPPLLYASSVKIKVGSKIWLLTCRSNITLIIPSYRGSPDSRNFAHPRNYTIEKSGD